MRTVSQWPRSRRSIARCKSFERLKRPLPARTRRSARSYARCERASADKRAKPFPIARHGARRRARAKRSFVAERLHPCTQTVVAELRAQRVELGAACPTPTQLVERLRQRNVSAQRCEPAIEKRKLSIVA